MQDPQSLVNKALAEQQKKVTDRMTEDLKKANELSQKVDQLFKGYDLPVIAFALAALSDSLEVQKPGIIHSARSIYYRTAVPQQPPVALIRR